MEQLSCDVLVIGSGAAGLRAAIAAREAGLEVMVISKGKPGKSTCTGFSAGVLAGSQNAAALKTHLKRTLEAGRGLNQRELVEVLVQEAPLRLQELMNWGIQAKFQNGYLYAQGRPPVLGEAIVHCLLQKNRDLGTKFMGDLLVTDLVTGQGVAGVNAWQPNPGAWLAITGKAVILATAGRPPSTGAMIIPGGCWGMAIAWRCRPGPHSRTWNSCSSIPCVWLSRDCRRW